MNFIRQEYFVPKKKKKEEFHNEIQNMKCNRGVVLRDFFFAFFFFLLFFNTEIV